MNREEAITNLALTLQQRHADAVHRASQIVGNRATVKPIEQDYRAQATRMLDDRIAESAFDSIMGEIDRWDSAVRHVYAPPAPQAPPPQPPTCRT